MIARILLGFTLLSCVAFADATKACFAPSATPGAGAEPGRRALLVGINKYEFSGPRHADPKQDFENLDGAAGDPVWLKSILTSKYGFKEDDVCVLTDLDATHAHIVNAFRSLLIANSKPGDVALFYFAGHGSYTEDSRGQFKDTTIMPADTRNPHPVPGHEVFDISTTELHLLFLDLLKKTTNVTSILDSCYSEMTVRGGPSRAVAPDSRRPPEEPVSRGGPVDLNPVSKVLRIAAAGRYQESHETNDHLHGLMSFLLFNELQNATEETTWNDVMTLVQPAVRKEQADQEPEIEGNADTKIFGGVGLAAKQPFLLVTPSRNPSTARLNGGSLLGLATDALFDVYAPGEREFTGAPIAKLKVTNVEDNVSDASVVWGTLVREQTGYRAVLRALPPAAFSFRIWFDGTGPQLAALQASAPSNVVGAEATGRGKADVTVRFRERRFEIERLNGAAPNPAMTASDTAAALQKLNALSQWYLKKDVTGAKPVLDLKILRNGRPVSTVADGENVTFRLCNTGDREYYTAGIDFQSDGEIAKLDVQWLNGESKIPAKECRTTEDITLSVDEGQKSGLQIFKAIASSTKPDLGYFDQNPRTTERGEPPQWSATSVAIDVVKDDVVKDDVVKHDVVRH